MIVAWKMGGKGVYRYRIQAESTDGRKLRGLTNYLLKSGWVVGGEIVGGKVRGFLYDQDFGKESRWHKFLRACPYEIWADTDVDVKPRKLARGKKTI